MSQFFIHFLICNVFIAGFIFIILCLKHLLKKHMSARAQYNVWFLILGLLAVPFLPFQLPGTWQIFQFLGRFKDVAKTSAKAIGRSDTSMSQINTAGWANDFAVSVSRDTPSILGFLLFCVWMVGIMAMAALVIRSGLRLRRLKKSALPLQNRRICSIFQDCRAALHITRDIPVYSTAFLKSPMTVGVLHPEIYIPIHLISDFKEKEIRYILLHELQHYRYQDAIPNYLMSIASILYWFNPAVWYAVKEMCTDREVACDSAVLQSLTENDYIPYGNTLINFAEKISLSPFPFASSLGGSITQIKKRIIHIASYQPLTWKQKLRGMCAYSVIAVLLLGSAPLLSTYAAENEYYRFEETGENVSYLDLSSSFQDYSGSFVLYDDAADTWKIYNRELATMRVAPNSTYKIYLALMGLEEDILHPEQTALAWDGTHQPFAEWNGDQDLNSAMHNSVNWYFERIERAIALETQQRYLNEMGYGNRDVSAGSAYWLESSLKISPIEQVELLKRLNTDQLSAHKENTDAIKNAICLASSPDQSVYGKTGTGSVNGQDINGWFIGYIEDRDQVYYFATNIQGRRDATGSKAAEITETILSDLQILN